MIAIVPATGAHVGPIAARMRAIDRMECQVFGRDPKQALRWSLMASALAWTARIDGRPEAMFGASTVSTIEGVGSPWLLMTDVAVRHARALVRMGRQYSDLMQRQYLRLENRVHADNVVAIRWLERLGYDIGGEVLVNGHLMREFSRVVP